MHAQLHTQVFYNTHRKHRFFEQTTTWVMNWSLNLMEIVIYMAGPFLPFSLPTYLTVVKVRRKSIKARDGG